MNQPHAAPDELSQTADLEALLGEISHLRQRERHLLSLLDSTSDAVLAMDASGHVIDWNPSAERLLGWSHDEAKGRLLSDLIIPPEHRQAHENGLRRYLDTGVSRILNRLVEVEALRKSGQRFPAELSVWRFTTQGDEVAFGAFLRDVTERKAVQQALVDAHARYKSVVEQLGEGMMLIQDGVVVFANPQAAEILRIEPERLQGLTALEILHPDDRAEVAERLARRDRGEDIVVHSEIRRLHGDGTVRWLGTHSSKAEWQGRPATMTFFSDITGSKALIDALHQSEERYRAVIEHVGEGMVVVKGTRFVFANRRAAEIVQMSTEDMLARGYLERIHPDDRILVDQRRQRRLAGEDVPNRYEIRIQLPDGQVRWLDIGVTIVPWEGETATLTFFSDVTERKALENRLTNTLQERETILESSIVGIAFLTPNGRLRWANRAMLDIFGTQPGDPLPETLEPVYPSREAYLRVGGEVAACIARGESYQTELLMRRLDGRMLWVSLSGKAVSPRDLGQGTVWGMMDISRRKELEDALARTSSEREAILNTALVGITYNVRRRIVWANDKCAEMTGYSPSALIGQDGSLLLGEGATRASDTAAAEEALRQHGQFSAERQLRRQDGSSFWALLAGRCVSHGDPDAGVIWTLLDITERKQAEEGIRTALAQQRELNELRSRFVAMTSHEFRTPLATILSSAELLRVYGDRMEAGERDELLLSIEAGVQRMTRMLDRVLTIGKTDADMLECQPRELDLRALCHTLVDEARSQHPHAGSEVCLSMDDAVARGCFDEKLLRHIFSNLLSNALKYSPAGGQVDWTVRREGDRVRFEVQDQGIGIPPDEIAHLFESFHRASNVGDIQGTGLGLAIVKKSVDLHQGQIDVHSTVGQGTRFSVLI